MSTEYQSAANRPTKNGISQKLPESGRHDDLLEREGLYASYWRVQTGLADSLA